MSAGLAQYFAPNSEYKHKSGGATHLHDALLSEALYNFLWLT